MATLEENYVAESHVESFWFWLLKFTEDFVYCKVSKQHCCIVALDLVHRLAGRNILYSRWTFHYAR